MSRCPACHGYGYIGPNESGMDGGMPCSACGGSGRVSSGGGHGGGLGSFATSTSGGGGAILLVFIILVGVLFIGGEMEESSGQGPIKNDQKDHNFDNLEVERNQDGSIALSNLPTQIQSDLSSRLAHNDFESEYHFSRQFLMQFSETGQQVVTKLDEIVKLVKGKPLELVKKDLELSGKQLTKTEKEQIAKLLGELWGHHRQIKGESGLLNNLYQELGLEYFTKSSMGYAEHKRSQNLSQEKLQLREQFEQRIEPQIKDLTLGVVTAMNYKRLFNIIDRSLENPNASNFNVVFDHPEYGAINNYYDSLKAFDMDLAAREVCEVKKFELIENQLPRLIHQSGGIAVWKEISLFEKRVKLAEYINKVVTPECRA